MYLIVNIKKIKNDRVRRDKNDRFLGTIIKTTSYFI